MTPLESVPLRFAVIVPCVATADNPYEMDTQHAMESLLPGSPAPRPVHIAPVLWAVAVVSLAVNIFSFSACQLRIEPDSRWYVELAVGIAERLDFSDERYLVRTPGYPLLLAGVFRAFGPSSPAVLLVLQHAMVVATTVLTALTAWYVCSRRSVALIGGLLAACNLHLVSYANLVMTEAPFAPLMVGSVCLLAKYVRDGRLRSLAFSSLLAGASCYFRPIGLTLVPLCVLAALARTFLHSHAGRRSTDLPISDSGATIASAALRRPIALRLVDAIRPILLAGVPACVAVLPAMMQTAASQDAQASRTAGLGLYHRTLFLGRLDSTESEALAEIRQVVAEAKQDGFLSETASHRRWWEVWRAYQHVRGASLAQSSAVMEEAAYDLVGEHWRQLARELPTHIARTVLIPDSAYRFHPGDQMVAADLPWDDQAIHLGDQYEAELRAYMDPAIFERYLPLRNDAQWTTPMWSSIARWYRAHMEVAASGLPLADTPHEAWILLCVLGGAVVLLKRERWSWLLVGGAVILQVAVPALLAGTVPRYAVPGSPLMHLFGVVLLVSLADLAASAWAFLAQRSGTRGDCRTQQRMRATPG